MTTNHQLRRGAARAGLPDLASWREVVPVFDWRRRRFKTGVTLCGPWRRLALRVAAESLAACALACAAPAQAPGAPAPSPNLLGRLERPLRYMPDHGDFVITNGGEFFNRPLYGGHTAFRVDAGDQPEFSLYLPGRGGNLRLGLRTAGGAKWLPEAASVAARYRPGEMLYEIRDPLLGTNAVLRLALLALDQTEGVIVRAELVAGIGNPDKPASTRPATEIELVWAYGGVTGERGRRDGDIGTEAVPIGEFFQLKPEFCRGNLFTIVGGNFILRSPPATIAGLMPPGAQLAVADAGKWASASEMLASAGLSRRGGPALGAGPGSPEDPARTQGPALQVIAGQVALSANAPVFLALQRLSAAPIPAEELATYREVAAARPGVERGAVSTLLRAAYPVGDLPAVFAAAEAHAAALRRQVTIETPDPFLDAAVGALNVAADAAWDERDGVVLHGAVAWRTPLLGWRGPYAPDALGWHARARRHFASWAARQNTDPVPARPPPPDESANLARSEAALHSNGDLSDSHYDMNLVYVDALFRHLLWTGDRDFARQMWPVIERHLAWERRLFRREFGPGKLPLYEAYACIWASDDLQYDGGGVAYASAYNFWHNRMAARLARLLGADPTPYEREADLIARAMRECLWVPERGMFAEFKDLLGRQLVHPSAGLWTFYHAMDAGLPTPSEAWRMTGYVDEYLPHLPVRGRGVPADGEYAVFATTDWMPYAWSVNNVVMGENVHTALAYWQAGRPEDAYRLLKSALLASMFMGICPGNVGSMNFLDVYRRESQRDFADGGGVLARAVVEGLFGVRPDLLAGELRLAPGFPASWDHASLRHPDVSITWRRAGETETFMVESHWAAAPALRLELPARRADAAVTIGNEPAKWEWLDRETPRPRIAVRCPPGYRTQIEVTWTGGELTAETGVTRRGPPRPSPGTAGSDLDWRTPMPAAVRLEAIDLAPYFNDRVTNIFRHEYRSPRSPYCSLAIPKQGIGGWAGEVNATAEIDDRGLRAAGAHGGRLLLPNGLPFATPGPGDAPNILFTSQWDNFPREAAVPLSGRARGLYLLMAGSTNWMQSQLDNGEVIVAYADGTFARLALHNPTNWWPIEQDYFIDDCQFRRPDPIPPRVDLKTGRVRLLDAATFKGQGGRIPGGAATVLMVPLEPQRNLKSLTIRALANEVVIGLMAATLVR